MFKQRLKFDERLIVEDVLASAPLFKSITADCRSTLLDKFNSKAFSEGEVVVAAETLSESLLLVVRGTCRVLSPDGICIQHLCEGEYFGETLLVGVEECWPVTLQAEYFAHIAEITREDFYSALEAFHDDRAEFAGLDVKHRSCMYDGAIHYTCDLFAGLSDRTLVELDGSLVRRMFWPGQKLLVQGLEGDELYVLVHGMVTIEIGGRMIAKEGRDTTRSNYAASPTREMRQVARIQNAHRRTRVSQFTPATNNGCICFGELGLLGMQPMRAATVIAASVCQVRVLYRPIFLNMVEKGEGVQLEPMFECAQTRCQTFHPEQLNTRLKDVRIFQDLRCGEEFLDFLAQNMQERIFIGGQKIVTEGTSDDRSMYVLDRGRAKVFKGDSLVTTLEAGAVVGEVFLLGLALQRTSSIVAEGTVYTSVLDQSIVIHGLQQFPEERRKVMMLAFRREQQSAAAASAGSQDGKSRPGSPLGGDRYGSFTSHEAHKMPTGEGEDDEEWAYMAMRVVMKAVASSDMFPGHAGNGFVAELGQAAVNHVFMPGERVMEEGASGNSMFIMISGHASVYTGKPGAGFMRIGKLTAGSISGELAMLGVSQTRSATIEAESFCCMWEITHSCALPIINRFPQVRDNFADIIVRHLQHTVPARMDSLPLFRGFDRKFGMMLSQYCDRMAFFCGEVIFKESSAGDGLCVLNLGRGVLTRKGHTVKAFASGSHFNSTIMLGVHKTPICTLTALQTCHVVTVPRMAYLQALEMYPSKDNHQSILQHETGEADKFRKLVERICVRANLWKKAQDGTQTESKRQAREALPDEEYLKRCFAEWLKRWVSAQRRRQEQERSKRSIDNWVRQKRATTAAMLEKRSGRDDESPSKRATSRAVVHELSKAKCMQRCRELSHVYLHWRDTDVAVAARTVFSCQRPRTLDVPRRRALPPLQSEWSPSATLPEHTWPVPVAPPSSARRSTSGQRPRISARDALSPSSIAVLAPPVEEANSLERHGAVAVGQSGEGDPVTALGVNPPATRWSRGYGSPGHSAYQPRTLTA